MNHKRNKAILALLCDLNGKNHEITFLKLKHIRFMEQYAESELSSLKVLIKE